MLLTTPPFPVYNDSDGTPLDEGCIYFGLINQNPETAPIPVYWDAAGTLPAIQPLRTVNGYIVRSGTPAAVYCPSGYSMSVKSKRGVLIYYCATPPATEFMTVADFGGDPTGVQDSSAAFTAANVAGQIIVPVGTFRVGNLLLSKKVVFQPGGKVSIDAGTTLAMAGGVSATDDQYIFAGTGNVSGLRRMTLNWFGAVGDEVADDTTSITRSVASAGLTGGSVTIAAVPGYNYRFTSTITVALDKLTFDFKNSEFMLDTATATASHFNIGDGITQKAGITFDGGVYRRAQVATAGAVFNCNLVGVTTFKNFRIYGENKIFRGILFGRAIITNVFDGYIQNTVSNGIYAFGTGTGANKTIDLKINRMRVEYTGADAVSCSDFVEGVYVENCILYNITGACFSANASIAANGMISLKLANTDFDTGTGAGIYLNFVSTVTIANPWVSNVANSGIRIDQADGVNIVGGQVYVTGSNQAIDLGSTGSFCRNISVGGGMVMSGGSNGVLTRAICQNINVGQVIINGMSNYAVNNILGPTQVTVVGASGRNNIAGGISAGGASLVVASNNFI